MGRGRAQFVPHPGIIRSEYLRNIGYLAGLLELAISHQEKFLNLFPILTSRYAEKQIPS